MKKKTQQRILDTSSELFNQYGIEAVSIAQVAAALKISTGNLTYYYKRKKDLVLSHANMLEHDLAESLDTFPYVSPAPVFAQAYVDTMALTQRYRFLFTGANYILQNELTEFDRYERLIKNVKRTMLARTNWLIKNGYMRNIKKPHSVEMLVDSIWWQWLGWLHVSQLQPPTAHISPRKMLADAAAHLFFVAQAYTDEAFSQQVQLELKRIGRGG